MDCRGAVRIVHKTVYVYVYVYSGSDTQFLNFFTVVRLQDLRNSARPEYLAKCLIFFQNNFRSLRLRRPQAPFFFSKPEVTTAAGAFFFL